jgi:hypothetical protein
MDAPNHKSAASRHGVVRIISGGQTGVDRGALDAAIELGIPHGGWCPKGRRAEDGPISDKYLLLETDSVDYQVRTERNVDDSDGTLILYRERLQRGTLLTHRLAKQKGKPLLRVRLDRPVAIDRIIRWLTDNSIQVLNVAGPRASSHLDIEHEACVIIKKIFSVSPPFHESTP